MVAVAVAMSASLSIGLNRAAGTQPPPTPQEQITPAERGAPGAAGLSDLDAVTFGCPKAALNAAAREAAKVRSQGTYQFSYFKIINDSHHSSYEIHFKSNYEGEPDLKVLRRHVLPGGMGSNNDEGRGHPDGQHASICPHAGPWSRLPREAGRDQARRKALTRGMVAWDSTLRAIGKATGGTRAGSCPLHVNSVNRAADEPHRSTVARAHGSVVG